MAFSRRFLPLFVLASLVGARPAAAQAPAFPSVSLPGAGTRTQLGAVAAGPAHGGFLAVWRDPADGMLRARLFGRDVAPMSGELLLKPAASTARPSAVYNARTDEFLVVWQGGVAAPHVWGQRIDRDGRPVGDVISVSSIDSAQGAPSVAVNAATGRALSVWDDSVNLLETDWDIVGVLLEPDGALAGGDLLLTYAPNVQLTPQVSCDPVRGRYLVVWEDEREIFGASTNRDIFAQVVDATGEMQGEPLLLSRTAAALAGVAVAARPGTGEFLAVWSDLGEGAVTAPDLHARRVFTDTGELGATISFIAPGDPIQPSIAFHAPSNQYLLGWTDRREFPGVTSLALARVLRLDGAPASDEFDLAADAHGVAIAPLPGGGPLLVGWSDAGRGGAVVATLDPALPLAPKPHVVDERTFTSDTSRLSAVWSTVGFADGIREYRTAVGTTPGSDDIAPWRGQGRPEEPFSGGSRTDLRLMEGRTYYFSVIAEGMDGRAGRVGVSRGVTVDQTAPRVAITVAPPASLTGTVASLAFAGSDALTAPERLRYRWRLDGGAWSLPTPGTTLRLEGLTAGEHRFEVQAIDLAENIGDAAAALFRSVP